MSDQTKESQAATYAWVGGLIFAIAFTYIIWLLGPLLDRWTLLPDQGATWYYWKLPERDFLGQFIVWSFYLAHQFSIWGSIYWAQKNLSALKSRPTSGLTKYNWAVIFINIIFITLHLVQTHIWFDGLAQDVPIWTSQGSVIVMLSIILVIENSRRGIFMGRKMGKPLTAKVIAFFRRNHTYIFAWALVYTFWFHPMSYDPQLITGFFYMFLLFTQVSLAYTWIHLDKRWIVFLEFFVGLHALVVAVFNTAFFGSTDMWPMFLSGFLFMFVFTGMYAFNVKQWVRWAVITGYVAFIIWLYLPIPFGYGRDLLILFRVEFLWIPLILYALAFVFAGIVYIYIRSKKMAEQDTQQISVS
jgi:hypothetical protein